MVQPTEQRHFQRVHFFQQVKVRVGEQVFETHCLDISLRGILLVKPEGASWPLEKEVLVTLTLSDQEVIEMHCSVAHMDDDVVGFACDSLDLDSMTALRRLLELNLSDPDGINRELGELIRSHS